MHPIPTARASTKGHQLKGDLQVPLTSECIMTLTETNDLVNDQVVKDISQLTEYITMGPL